MPRGYLKNCKHTSKKLRRGGSKKSRKTDAISALRSEEKQQCSKTKNKMMKKDIENEYYEFYNYQWQNDTGDMQELICEKKNASKNEAETSGICAICWESKAVLKILKNCNHASACYECLRQMYVIRAQTNVDNYPLRCFHPNCNGEIRDTQLMNYAVVHSTSELRRHLRLSILVISYREVRNAIIHCPTCDHPSRYTKKSIIRCKNCDQIYANAIETNQDSTIRAVEAFKTDNMGINDGWAKCPNCKIIISKGDGCDHMRCICGTYFSWYRAREGVKPLKVYPTAIVKDTKIK